MLQYIDLMLHPGGKEDQGTPGTYVTHQEDGSSGGPTETTAISTMPKEGV